MYNREFRSGPSPERGRPTIIHVISNSDHCSVTQQAFAAVGKSDIHLSVNFPGGNNLPKELGSPFWFHAEQVRDLMKLEPSCVIVEPTKDCPAATRADVLYLRRHCAHA
jgi:hypothetical protein